MLFLGIFRQDIIVVNEIVLQYTNNLFFFLTENIHHEAENHVPFRFRLSVRFVPSTNSTPVDMNRDPQSAKMRM